MPDNDNDQNISLEQIAIAAHTDGVNEDLPFGYVKHPRKRAFLITYAACGNQKRAADAAKIGITTIHKWRKDEDEGDWFREQMRLAKQIAVDLLEGKTFERCLNGMPRMKFHQGEAIMNPLTGQPYVEMEFPESTVQFLLKGEKPEKYRERHEVTGPDGEAVKVEFYLPQIAPLPTDEEESEATRLELPEPSDNGEDD